MIRHYLNFISSQHGRLEISEPEGFDKTSFVIKKSDDRLGRDVSYASGKSALRVWRNSQNEYHFDKILYNWEIFSFNAVIKYEIEFDDTIYVIGELDLGETFKTNIIEYADFSVLQENFVELFKRFFDTNINLFDNVTLFGLPIAPTQRYKMLYRALPTNRISRWNAPLPYSGIGAITQKLGNSPTKTTTNKGINPSFGVLQGDIKKTLSFITPETALSGGVPNLTNFTYLEAEENLSDIEIELTNIDLEVRSSRVQEDEILTASGFSRLVIRFGFDINTSTMIVVHQENFNNSDSTVRVFPETFTVALPNLERGMRVWIYLENNVSATFESDPYIGLSSYFLINDFASMDVQISATSTAYNTVFDVVRLYDAMQYSAKTVTGEDIDAPRWGSGGEFYNQFLTTTALMRHQTNRAFNISNKTIAEKYLPEVYADYESQQDGKTFYGIYRDFYKNIESGKFLQKPSEYEVVLNPKYACNKITYKYDNFQSQKEIETEGTLDIVHGENERMYNNPKAQNEKEVSVGFVRDPKMTNEARIKAYTESKTSASQDDNKIFIIDSIVAPEILTFTETDLIQHTPLGNFLILRNENSLDWGADLGINTGSTFIINSGVNQGTYIVNSTTENTLELFNQNGYTLVGNEATNTRFTYQVTGVDYINRTNEGFSTITGLSNGDKFGNLRFTVTRNQINYYSEFNATNTLFANSQEITNRLYNNNPDAATTYEGVYVREGDPIIARQPILSNKLINTVIVCSLQEWFAFQENIRTQRGFMTILDSEGIVDRGYLVDGEWLAETAAEDDMSDYYGSAKLVLEQKYSPETLNIFGSMGDITINGNIVPSGFTFHVNSIGKLTIFDATGELLYMPVLFNRVTINGQVPESKTEMAEWMEQLTTEWDGI